MSTLDTAVAKKPYQKTSFTEQDVKDLKGCLDPVNGPLYFIENFVYIQHPTKGKLPFKPFPFQKDLIHNYHNYDLSISLVARQMGKSVLASAYLLWKALFESDSTILIASNRFENASEIMQKIRYAYQFLPDHIRAGAVSYNKRSLEFDNGSRIIAQGTTENTGRGLALSLVYLDEFAFVEPRMAREFWTSISPTLATGGKCIITSTPNNDEDQFAEIWFQANDNITEDGKKTDVGKNGFKPYFATWEEHPERDEEWAEKERNKIGENRFKREHLCEFVSWDETLINAAKLASLRGVDPIRTEGKVRWYRQINPDKTYVLALDPSLGTGGDNAAIQILELPTMKQVGEWSENNVSVEHQIVLLRTLLKEINRAGAEEIYWSVENNTLGEAALVVIRDIGEDSFPGMMLHGPRKQAGAKARRGFTTTNTNKLETCVKLKSLIESKKLQIYSRNLISELKTFVASGNTYKAKTGQNDDLTMALILAVRMILQIAQWDDEMHRVLTSGIVDDIDDDEMAPMPILF